MRLPRRLAVRVRARNRRHRCYELAVRGVMLDPSWVLCHGLKWTRVYGERQLIAHAWLARGDLVYDPALDAMFDRTEYTAAGERYYTAAQAASLMAASGVYGPWTDDERATV